MERHTVTDPASRLDQYLAALLPATSRTQVQRLIRSGLVQVNGMSAPPGRHLRAGDQLTWEVPPIQPSALEPEPMKLAVLYEDEDLMVIDKPAGLVVHPGPGHRIGTLVHGLLARGSQWSQVGGSDRPGIVHRLDRDTSGLMVVARNDAAHGALVRQLQARTLPRRYRAIVVGEVAEEAARIEAAIGRDPRDRKRMAVLRRGREAVTEFRRLEVVPGHSLLEVTLKTGRTHQIRVHLAYIHHPILGDPVYGRRSAWIARPALHAAQLSLHHPRTGRVLSWKARPPDDFIGAWRALGGSKMP